LIEQYGDAIDKVFSAREELLEASKMVSEAVS